MPQQAPKPGHQHIHLRDILKTDWRALQRDAALAEPPTSATQIARDLIHARAMQAQPGPATAYQYTIRAPINAAPIADDLLDNFVRAAEAFGVEVTCLMVKVDDNGNPVA